MGRSGKGWWSHSPAAIFVATALALIGNLATETIDVDAPWWGGLMWSLVGVLFVAAAVVEATRRGGEAVTDQDIEGAVRDLEQELLDAYADQTLRHGASPTQIDVRFRPTRDPGADDETGGSDQDRGWDRFLLGGDVSQIVEAFQSLARRQLIVLGEPGAGKSVLALLLSWRLLEKRTSGEPVPVFLPISSWDPTAETVDEFVASRLRLEHPQVFRGRGADLARMLMTPLRIDRTLPPVQHVLPVLDGLDELRAEHIPAAIRKLHEFMAAGRPLVVTCRSREYTLIMREERGALEQAAVVEILPVALEQVIAFLGRPRADRARWEPVFAHLEREPGGVLAATLTTPLTVTMTRTAYRETGSDPAELTRLKTRTEIRDRLIDRYVGIAYAPDPMLVARRTGRRYRPERAARWLGTLAFHSYQQGTLDLAWRSLPLALMNPRSDRTAFVLSCGGIAAVAALGYAAGSVRGAIAGAVVASAVSLNWAPLQGDEYPIGRYFALPALAAVTGLATGIAVGATWTGALVGALAGLAYAGATGWRPLRPAALRVWLWSLLGVGGFAAATVWRAPDRVGAWSATAAVIIGGGALLSLRGWPWARDRASHLLLVARGWLPLRTTRFARDAYERGVMRRSGSVWQFRHALINERLARPAQRRSLIQRAAAGRPAAQRELADSAPEVGDVDEVVALLRRRVARRDRGATVILADLLYGLGETADGLAVLRQGVRRGHGNAMTALADRLDERGEEEELRALAERGLIRAVVRLRARLLKRGDTAGAAELLRTAVRNGPRSDALRIAALPGEDEDPDTTELARRRAGWFWSWRHRRNYPAPRPTARGPSEPDDLLEVDRLARERDLAGLARLADAGSRRAQERLAELLADLGDAEALAARAAQGDTFARSALIRVLRANGDEPGLMRLVTHERSIDAVFELQQLYVESGRHDEAIAVLRPFAARSPEAACALAGLLTDRGNLDEAVAVLRRHARRDDGAAQQLAELHLRRGDRARAIAVLRRRGRRSGWCAIKLAELHTERDEIREAIEVLEESAARESYDEVGGGPAGRHLFEFLRRRTDVARLRTWAARDERAVPQLLGLLTDLGDIDGAIAFLRPRVDLRQGADNRRRLAALLRRRGDLDELRRRAQRGDAFAGLRFAELAYELGQPDTAAAMLTGYVEKSPTWGPNDPARRSLAGLLRRQGHADLLLRMAGATVYHDFTGVVATASAALIDGRRDAAIELLWRHIDKYDFGPYRFRQRQGDDTEIDEVAEDLLR
ncbi:hypothetical protein ACIBSW_38070 [Actinoplanes sp. NPDC049668]|uniref:hypothetical protein n=1 Tax=unclassified Actinoplanes TaxID=2626549 RepID=UPI0033AEA244